MTAHFSNRVEIHAIAARKNKAFDESAQFGALNVLGAAQRMWIVANIQALNLNRFGVVA